MTLFRLTGLDWARILYQMSPPDITMYLIHSLLEEHQQVRSDHATPRSPSLYASQALPFDVKVIVLSVVQQAGSRSVAVLHSEGRGEAIDPFTSLITAGFH